MKPIVNCELVLLPLIGSRCFVIPKNHPNHLPGHGVSNKSVAMTSFVVSINEELQQFETENTIYQWELKSCT